MRELFACQFVVVFLAVLSQVEACRLSDGRATRFAFQDFAWRHREFVVFDRVSRLVGRKMLWWSCCRSWDGNLSSSVGRLDGLQARQVNKLREQRFVLALKAPCSQSCRA